MTEPFLEFSGVAVRRVPFETIDGVLRRLKKAVAKADLATDMRRHDSYLKPSVRRRAKARAARRRQAHGGP